jgi:hypothetical protein
MNPDELLKRIKASGLTTRLADGKLLVGPRSRMTADLAAAIAANRDALIEFLTTWIPETEWTELDRWIVQSRTEPLRPWRWDYLRFVPCADTATSNTRSDHAGCAGAATTRPG